jgi:NAD(P)-dependent dehydrogenase (short-subunit alcohol dehydrogenase family)
MKRVFVTGASAGIGQAITRALLARGDDVWGTSRDRSRLPVTPGLHAVQLDLEIPGSIKNAFSSALEEAGHFDVVINNAGNGHFGAAEFLSQELISQQFRVLVFAQIELTQLALGAMRTYGSGVIINVSSLAARLPVPFMAGYNAAKAALAMFTMTLQLELGASSIRLIDLQPADISTGFNDSVLRNESDAAYEEAVAKTWKSVEQNMKNAPPPDLVARRVCQIIDSGTPAPRVTVGDAVQAGIGPVIFRFLPQRVRLWGLKKYYGI